MGLRFRKSISIIPGVKLNFGKTGMSVSTGVPGFRKTYHTSGRVTTSVGIPGTGLYYVDTKNIKTQSSRRTPESHQETSTYYSEPTTYEPRESSRSKYSAPVESNYGVPIPSNYELSTPIEPEVVEQLDTNSLKSIHKTSDDSIDWTEVLVSPMVPDETYNQQMWAYYHNMAPKILAGDIDSYLQLIYEVNPLDDLLVYGSNYEFGTDDPKKIEVEYNININALSEAKQKLSNTEYNLLLQDYVCSVCIRIARDMFALLPIKNTIVHAVLDGKIIVSVDFDRQSLSKVKFGYIDPSDTIEQFKHNIDFNENSGFSTVSNLE
ncbi:MAG: DUF4236 domain-containing protein [Eubacteriales bacterium]|nr:DUF4236 domain-containing protein [Eubacteriales bacterium]